jgi:hypothetical protein
MVILPHRRKAFKTNSSGSTITDPDVLNYQSRIIAAGSSISNTQLTYIETFVISLKSYNNWNFIDRLNVFCGNDLTAALVPLKNSIGATTDINNNFVSADYGLINGITGGNTGGGLKKYIDTGVNANTLDRSNYMYGVYNLTANSSSIIGMMGSSTTTDVANNRHYVLVNRESGTAKFYGGQGTYFVNSVTLSTAKGLVRAVLNLSQVYIVNFYFNNTFITGLNYNGGGFQSAQIVVMGNVHGAAGVTNSSSGYFMGKQTMPNQSQFVTDWNNLITNLGR